jgi:hypothetical protein
VSFALAETGERLPRRLADQRRYLKDEFERYEEDKLERTQFVAHLHNMASFYETAWEEAATGAPHFDGLPVHAASDNVRLCIAFLRSLNHTVAIAPLVRFYAVSLTNDLVERANRLVALEQAFRAVAAFSALWRASRRTTGNIDQEYRQIMGGMESLTKLPPLARRLPRDPKGRPTPIVDVAAFKAELRARLEHPMHGGIAAEAEWVDLASQLPLYEINTNLTRFILLAAYHDTVIDPSCPGLIMPGKDACAPCLTFDGWRDDKHLNLEHVAPQTESVGWSPDLYKDPETVHRIGNLVLVPTAPNSSLGARPWTQKRVLYSALGAASREAAKQILDDAETHGITFGTSTEELVGLSKHMPHLAALGEKIGDWDVAFVAERSRRLLELAWRRLRPWLD